MQISFGVQSTKGHSSLEAPLEELIIAGWAGRDMAAIEHHIVELEAIGVPRPSTVPLFYRVAASQASQAERIEVVGPNTSGEIEPFLFIHGGELYVSIASDHTDRSLETHSVALSKQICSKPIALSAWPYAEVRDHWDELILRSWIETDEGDVLYQEGRTGSLRTPEDLLNTFLAGAPRPDGLGMSCGTVPVIGGIRPTPRFRMELCDGKLQRTLTHRYVTTPLPEVA